MKTPEEIKKGLQHCSEDGCKGCNYEDDCDMADGFSVLASDALVYIQQLEKGQRHGKWDDSGRYKFADGSIAISCTECGCALHHNDYVKYVWSFCPVCGAKMDGEEDEAHDESGNV